ncbi:MAG TPA: alpha/beta fold hydrolase [Pyrinomonadaceae bacterium]|nr:alpha/beta fold hydrolase [Pyrinomonadaceae bacterium]
MLKDLRAFCAVALTVFIFNQPAPALKQSPASQLTVRDIMAEPSIAGMRPVGEKLSPNGEQAAFLWSATGREPHNLYLVSTRGGEPKLLVRAVDKPQESRADKTENRDEARAGEGKEERVMQRDAVQQARERSVSGIEWSPDSRRLLFSKNGDLYVVSAGDAPAPRRLTRTSAVESGARWLADSRRVLYQSDGNLFVVDADQTAIVQLTRENGDAAVSRNESQSDSSQQTGARAASGATVSGAKASVDGARVAYIVSDTSKQRALVVPDYTGEFVNAPTVRRGWTEQRIQIVNSDGSSERAALVKLPAPEGVSYLRGFNWTPDNSSLVIDRIDLDTKRRQIFLAAASDGASVLVDEERDAKWIAPLSRIVEVAPKGDRVLFASERDGFNHLYLATLRRSADSGQANALSSIRQLTRGNWEVSWAKWLPDGERIVYSSTEASTAERHLYLLHLADGKSLRLPTEKGLNTDPQLSEDGAVILYEHSEWNVPNDLWAMRVCQDCRNGSAKPVRLTNTVPEAFKRLRWAQPRFIEYNAKDGKQVRARVYTPPSFSRSKKHPAVVFVHGAGYLQNIVNGWNNYYREAMFHHILTERGYVVLDVDYRGSAGYGRDWRTDVYDFLGGLDLQDHLDGIDHIVKNYAVDPSRVGIYGGSYGGFMALMAAMRAPERIACAAALRPVADWKNYYAASPIYTTERLGFPDKNAEAYRRSSPITYADQLRRPLLILHGMVDDNVHFQDSVQLVQKLIELGKSEHFDVMFYPKENHSFIRPESWTDEYERILRLMDEHLRP